MRKSYSSNVAFKILLPVSFLLVSLFGANAQTYTINNGAPASATNFQTFNAAYNAIKATTLTQPVVFNVAAGSGPYNEQLIIKAIPGATATNTVTFNGNGVQIGTAFTGTTGTQRAIIKLDGASFITIDSLTINADAGPTYGIGVQLLKDADSNIISRCTINTNTTSNSNSNYAGIVINALDAGITGTGNSLCDYNIFYKNKIKGGYYGIADIGTDPGGTNGHNRFLGNIVTDFYQYGIYFSGTYNSIIDSNVISRPTRTSLGAFYGVQITGSNISDTVSRNFIKQPFDGAPANSGDFYGINHDNAKPLAGFENYVINNVVSASNGNGKAFGIANTASTNVQYYHNTVSIENALSTSTAAARGFTQTTAADGIAFYDNLISIYRGGSGQKHCIYLSGTTTSFICDYNNLFISANGSNNYIGSKGSNYVTLQTWKTATLYDVNSASVDPVYVDTANENYQPQNAAFDNKGLYLGIDFDIYNNPRSTNGPDMGAIEFVPPPCVAPPTAGITLFNLTTKVDTTVCENTLMPLGLLGNSFGSFQTFKWETSPTGIGSWTTLGNPLTLPDTVIVATTTYYIRAAVTCGGSTVYSNALKLNVTPALPAGTYTIAGGATTYVPGVPGGNFSTFADAKAAMSCGIKGNGNVIFNVNNGPYNEQFTLPAISGTSPASTITFNGNGKTIAFSSAVGTEKAVIKLSGTKYITFDSLVIDARGNGGNGFGVHLLNDADTNTFRRCTILIDTATTSNAYAGVVINGSAGNATGTGNSLCDGNLFDKNTIIGGYYGIVALANTTSVINNNTFTNNNIREFYNYGIYLGSGNFNTLVEGNRISRPARSTGAGTIYGIYVKGAGSAATVVSRNRIYNLMGGMLASNNTTYGITHDDADGSTGNPHTVVNNLLFKFSGAGTAYGLNNIGSTYINYYHNTVAIENLGSNPTGASRGFSQSGTSTGTQFKNNIVTVSRDGTGTKHVIYLATQADVESDYNNLYINSTGGAQNYLGFNGVNRIDLGAWQANTVPGEDAHSLSYDPGYVNPALENYAPVVSPLDNVGTPLGITTDILGNPRSSTTPDIGAFEFTVPPCGVPAITTATVNPNTGICVGVPILLDVPGAASASGLTYVWQNSPDGVGNWTNISDTLYFPKFNTLSLPDHFYRVQIICSGIVYYSTVVSINMNLLLVGGSYSINKNNPTNYTGAPGANFNSYADAVSQMNCGITGPIVFNVSADTYTEQVLIHKVPGLGIVNAFGRNTVTFQSANAATSILTFSPTLTTANYTVKIDTAKYVTFRNLTISNTSATNGRVVDISGASGFDTIMNCIITTPATNNAANTFAAVYSSLVNDLYIKGNTITNGSAGIYLAGTSTVYTSNIIVDGNTVSNAYNYGIYVGYSKRVKILNNNANVSSPITATAYGIYTTNCDTAYRILGNSVNITNATSGTVNGLYQNKDVSSLSDSGIVASNRVTGTAGNTAKIFGLVNNASEGLYTINNVIAITSAGNASYGLQSVNTNNVAYYNNSVNMNVPGDSLNFAVYFNHTNTTANVKIRNNIFSNKGLGRALYINNPTFFFSDYNDLYTDGAILAQVGTPAARYATITPLRRNHNWEISSIVFPPAFVSDLDLHPNLTSPDVWAIHGRGVQATDNSYDFNNNPRPTTLAAGVPDLGAYEFHPTVDPTVLFGTPLTPVAGQTQTFMYGSDTVMKINWAAASVVPPAISIKRYSGDAPPQLPATLDSMYFYTTVDIPGGSGTNYKCTVQQFFVDSWQGTIQNQRSIAMGRTVPSHAWYIDINSLVDASRNVITDTSLTFLDKFTGLVNPYYIELPDNDNSNRGKHFWCAYPINELDGGSNQQMVIYLSAEQDANVEVRIDAINFVKNYFVPANTVKVSDIIPLTAFVNTPGQSNLGININSFDNPIVAYTHITGSASSGAGMLMPVGVWGYEYQTLSIESLWGSDAFTYYYVIADHDNTQVEITSVAGTPVQTPGPTPGTPFTVTLNKGDFYQVVAESDNDDLSGSLIKSVPGTDGKCYPVAVFCGSGRAAIGCPPSIGGSGDFIMQQVFPYQAWGKRYITTPTSASTAANSLQPNVFRVTVRDPSTIVKRNGTTLTSLVTPGNYYQYVSSTADYIEANKPIMVAQFITDACTGDGDPEMIYISPIEQGIKNIGFYRNTVEDIDVNLLTLVVPTDAVASTVGYEGPNTTPTPNFWTYTYPHPRNGQPYFRGVNYTVLVKRWGTSAQQQVRISSDSAFTAITYGLGVVESYGYNAGTLVKNLSLISDPGTNHGDSIISSDHTCAGTPYSVSFLLPVSPDSLRIQWSASPAIPNNDVVQIAPVPAGIVIVNTDTFYRFVFTDLHTFPAPGAYTIPVQYSHPSFEGCNKTKQDKLVIQVFPEPRADFTVTSPVCEGDTTFFRADSITANGLVISKWTWKFHDGSTVVNNANPYKIYPAGTYYDTLKVSTPDGCIGDTAKPVVVTMRPTVNVVQDTIIACLDSSATFVVLNPIPGATYNWYDSATGVVPIHTGDTLFVPNVTTTLNYYVEVIYGCSGLRKQVTALVQPGLPKPQPVATAGATDITWTWPAIPGAVRYEVQVIGTGIWVDPSSGQTGTTNVLGGLTPSDTRCLLVRVIGATACLNNISDTVCATVGCPNVTVSVTPQNDSVCAGQQVTFTATASQTGVSFNWYDTQTGGTLLSSANPYTFNATATDTVFVEGVLTGCSYNRVPAIATVFNQLPSPTFNASSPVTDNSITFNWNAVAGATAYEVETSLNPGVWITPSSGTLGLSHLVSGLSPRQPVTLQVRALGTLACQTSVATAQSDTTSCNTLVISVSPDTVSNCAGQTVTLQVANPISTYTYTWLNTVSGYTVVGPSQITVIVGTTDSTYTVQATSGASCVSNIATVVVHPGTPLNTPQNLTATPALTSVTFNWSPVAGATGYEVSTDGINYTAIGSVTTYVVTPLAPGQSVSFYVRAVNGVACLTSLSASLNANALPCPVLSVPVVTVSDSTQNSVTFTWPAIAGANGYTVVSNGNTINLPSTTTTYTVTGLNPAQTVSINVTAVNVSPCPAGNTGSGTGTTKGCVVLPAPVRVNFIDSSSTFATFSWPAVSGATGYKVEVQTGNPPGAWTVVSANQAGTTITISGLITTDSVRVRITSLGTLACETSITATVGRGKTSLDQVYIPNAFTPNGSGNPENERLRVYSNIIKEGRFLIFNQWGQKIFEANTIADMKNGWDGTYSGKPQPVGVYVFVGKFTLTNGSVIEKKGSINLVR